MAVFEDSMKLLLDLEFSSENDALEWNETEDGYTFMGIYEIANPDWKGWSKVREVVAQCDSIKEASKILYNDPLMVEAVYDYYYDVYWKPYKLNKLNSQHVADEIYVFGVNVGMKKAIKAAQELAGVDVDGSVGPDTLNALNGLSASMFDREFDDEEIEYYKKIVDAKPEKARFLKGWINRAEAV